MILDANLLSSAVFLFTSIPILLIGSFFFFRPRTRLERLQQLLSCLFIAWGVHFAAIGLTIACDGLTGTRCMEPELMRLMSAAFVFIEFVILVHLYSYIRNHHV